MVGRGTEVGGARVAGRGCCWPDARGNNCVFAVMRAAAALAGGTPSVSLAAPVLSAAVPEAAGAASAMLHPTPPPPPHPPPPPRFSSLRRTSVPAWRGIAVFLPVLIAGVLALGRFADGIHRAAG